MTVPAFDSAARTSKPRLPSLRTVLLEQVRVTGIALRGGALLSVGLLTLLSLFSASQVISRGADLTLNAWPTQVPGVLGALLPIAVWMREERYGPGFLWTLPVDRRGHALTKVFAGWLWLMVAVAAFVVWVLIATSLTGGRALPPESLQVVSTPLAFGIPIDPATLRTASWSPGIQLWLVPFTAATACYLLASALALGTRHPVRWVVGAVVTYVLSSIATETASAQLGAGWLYDAPSRFLDVLVDGRFGLDALLTARIESLSNPMPLTTGKSEILWYAVPDLSDWRIATALWTGAGLVALWAATSRHRERRSS